MIKRYTLLAILLASILLITPNLSFGATSAETQTQIQAIMAQIQALQTQLSQLKAQQSDIRQWCHTFGTNLKIGDTGDEVSALQTALQKEGFSISNDETAKSGGTPMIAYSVPANFGESTATAVTGFQEKYRSEILTPNGLKYGTGHVGKSTRAKLNQLYGCGTTAQQPSITIISPNGGEVWQIGSTQTVKWTSNKLSSSCGVDKASNACAQYYSRAVYGVLIDSFGKNFDLFKAPEYVGSAQVAIPSSVIPGSYTLKLRVYSEAGYDVTDTSNAPFSIVAQTVSCPLYAPVLCGANDKAVSGGIDANGCQLPGNCVPISVLPLPSFPAGQIMTKDISDFQARAKGYLTGVSDGEYLYLGGGNDSPSVPRYNGLQARYKPSAGSISDQKAWEFFNTMTIVPQASGIEGIGFSGNYVYYSPAYGCVDASCSRGDFQGYIVRYNKTKPFTERASWEGFDLMTIDSRLAGYSGVISDGRYVYFMPSCNRAYLYDCPTHGNLVRYDTAKQFNLASSYEFFDLRNVSPTAHGFNSGGVFDGRYIYLVPAYNISGYDSKKNEPTSYVAGTAVVRYDTQKPFRDVSSYQAVDVSQLNPLAGGYFGATFDGTYVYFSPNARFIEPSSPRQVKSSLITRLNTKMNFTDPNAWSFYDIGFLSPNARGFMLPTFDGRSVYFSTIGNERQQAALVARYDTQSDFTSASSWTYHDWTDELPEARGSRGIVYVAGSLYTIPSWPDGAHASGLIMQIPVKSTATVDPSIARDTKRIEDLIKIAKALDSYTKDNGKYPGTYGTFFWINENNYSGLLPCSTTPGGLKPYLPSVCSLNDPQGYQYAYAKRSDGTYKLGAKFEQLVYKIKIFTYGDDKTILQGGYYEYNIPAGFGSAGKSDAPSQANLAATIANMKAMLDQIQEILRGMAR